MVHDESHPAHTSDTYLMMRPAALCVHRSSERIKKVGIPFSTSPSRWHALGRNTHILKESVAVPVPSVEQLDALAFGFGPGVSVRQGRKEGENNTGKGQDSDGPDLVEDGVVAETGEGETSSHKIEDLAEGHDGKNQGGEVMVQEQLAGHEEERKVVQGPSENRSTNLVVKSLEVGVGVVLAASLPTDNSNRLEDDIHNHGKRRRPPDKRVTNEVDLTVVSTPEVNSTAEDRPRVRPRIPGVRFNQTCVGLPHNLLQLPEFPKKSGAHVVDFLGIGRKRGVVVRFDVPQAVGLGTLFGAGDFLLLGCPVWQFDFVGEERTTCHDVDETELGLNSPEPTLGNWTIGILLDDLDSEEVISIPFKPLVSVSRNLVLPILLRDRGADIVGMQSTVRGKMIETNEGTICDEVRGYILYLIPSLSTVDHLAVGV